jgi:cathepsin B
MYLKLNGVKPAASRGEFSGSEEPAPFSSLAAAPGLARASALGSRAAKTEKQTDTPWGVGARSDASTTRALRAAFDPESVGLPRAFDAREAFSKCAGVIGSVRDQGKCGSCWAVAATEVVNDRLCVASDGRRRRELSPQYALSCFDAGAGCDGGDVLATLREMAARGVPYGGMGIETDEALLGGSPSRTKHTNSTTSTQSVSNADVCVPYEFEPCDHPCQVPGTRAAKCPATCADGSELELVFPASEAYACPPGDWACIAREIHTFGSVAVTFGSVRADFYEHETGVYRVRDVADPGLGQHATKLIGWGFDDARDDPDPYWIMMNSWRNWGENGAGRVGVGEMNIESGISAVRM